MMNTRTYLVPPSMLRWSSVAAMILIVTGISGQFWTQRADLPLPVYAPFSFSVDDRNYVGGGALSVVPLDLTDQLFEYDPSQDEWTPRAPLPGSTRYGTPGFSIQGMGKGYVVCGWHDNIPQVQLADLWEYDPVMDQWTERSPFPGSPRYSLVSVGTTNKAYAGLGYNPWHNDWYEYDPVADSWTQKASFPGDERQACNAFFLNGSVYVGMGTTNVIGGTAVFFNDLFRYDPLSDTWTQVSSFPGIPRASSYYFSTCDLGYIMGGIAFDLSGSQAVLTDFWSYDPVNDEWAQLPDFPTDIMNTGTSFAINGSGYLGGGGTGYQPDSWVVDSITPAFWEYKSCDVTGLNEGAANIGGLRSFVLDGMLQLSWEPIAEKVTIILRDIAGREISDKVVTWGDPGSLRVPLGPDRYGLVLIDWRTDRVRMMNSVIAR